MSDRKKVIERVKEILQMYSDRLQGYGSLSSLIYELIQYVEDGNELKPCPFCGGTADYIIKPNEGVFVMCRNCGNRTGFTTDYDDKGEFVYNGTRAIDWVKHKWNSRVGG